ncbi:MAG: Crp/Fnr family transcriptional regulator [Ignavibacteriales bacterium]|nr:MAG: Crp/Fnr family transcriptional regulator [Ignavibacteriales bacterium]
MSEREILEKIPAFSSFDGTVIELIQKAGINNSFVSEEKILSDSSDKKSGLLIVNSGRLKVELKGSDQSTVVLTNLSAGEFWGEYGLLDGNNLDVEITAVENGDMIFYSRTKLFELIADDKSTLQKIISQLSSKIRDSHFILDSLLLKDSDAKVARTILKLGLDTGYVKSGMLEINKLPIQHELARMAGTSRETFSRTLQSFAKKGLIELEGSKLRLKEFLKLRDLLN